MNILANDGISQSGVDALTANGFNVITTNVAQEQLVSYINNNNIVALLVRSATNARKDLIDACPNLKIIGRGGFDILLAKTNPNWVKLQLDLYWAVHSGKTPKELPQRYLH